MSEVEEVAATGSSAGGGGAGVASPVAFNVADVTTGRLHLRRPIRFIGGDVQPGNWELYTPAQEEQKRRELAEGALAEQRRRSEERRAGMERLRIDHEQRTVLSLMEKLKKFIPALPIEDQARPWLAGVVPDNIQEFEAYTDDPIVDCPGSKTFPLCQCKRSQLEFARRMAGWKEPAVSEPSAPPKKVDPEPSFLYAPRTFDAKVWGDDKGCAFKDSVAAMSQPWDGRGP